MNRQIKFKRAHFIDEECNQFSHYSEWGVGIKGSTFTSPSSNNYALYFIDYKLTGLKDKKGVDICEFDILKSIYNSIGNLVCTPKLVYEDLRWVLKGTNGNFEYLDYYESYTELLVIGNVYENPELLK